MAPSKLLPTRPLDLQKGLGGDMSMMFFARPQLPRKLSASEQQLIKGLNIEAIVFIDLPPPPWLEDFHYRALIEEPGGGLSQGASFSLNVSMYNRPLHTADWEGLLFFFCGRVHPYALTWEVASVDTNTTDHTQNYTIPALIVRDNGYYPLGGRMFDGQDELPPPSPIVTFTGPVIGPGTQLLPADDSISGISETQRRCCGFVQLSTFLAPGNPTKTPFRGFHPFQVFVIFPLHVNPWTFLCKKMAERHDTHFQPNSLFSCTGKVVGLLNHRLMTNPPPSAQDHVFIVVPDTWSFPERSNHAVFPNIATPTTPIKQPPTVSLHRSQFMSPSTSAVDRADQPQATPSKKRSHSVAALEPDASEAASDSSVTTPVDTIDESITVASSKLPTASSMPTPKRARVDTSTGTTATSHRPTNADNHTSSQVVDPPQAIETRKLRNQNALKNAAHN